jgi:hypothetical protein
MSIKGSPYPRFRRALLTGNLNVIEAAAAELPAVDLEDALRILVVMAEKRDARFDRAAARWAARAALERRLDTAASMHLLALVQCLPSSPAGVGELLKSAI